MSPLARAMVGIGGLGFVSVVKWAGLVPSFIRASLLYCLRKRLTLGVSLSEEHILSISSLIAVYSIQFDFIQLSPSRFHSTLLYDCLESHLISFDLI